MNYLTSMSLGSDIHILDCSIVAGGAEPLLRVVVDTPGGVTIDQLMAISRQLRGDLALAEVIGTDSFRLEMTSPGVKAALKEPWQYQRHIGRRLQVLLTSPDKEESTTEAAGETSRKMTGKLLQTDQDGIVLDVDSQERRVPWSRITLARVQLDW